jgi:hypothetical protein
MSLSQPRTSNPHPCQKWYEWNGEKGNLRWYDKQNKKNVEVDLPFSFILLDELFSITGWHEPSGGSIYSNEIRDTRDEPFVVRSFGMKEIIAEGFYSDIKDKVAASGGKFSTGLYMAFNDPSDNLLKLGCLKIHGSALNAWVDAKSEQRKVSKKYDLAGTDVEIADKEEGKKGRIVFQKPVLVFSNPSEEALGEATEIDKQLQTYFLGYFKRTRADQAQPKDDTLEQIQETKIQDEKDDDSLPEVPF